VKNAQQDEKNQEDKADSAEPSAATLWFIARRVHAAEIKTRMAANSQAGG